MLRRVAALVCASCAIATPAAAGGDYRPTDRFFFALGAGSQGLLGPSPEGAHLESVGEVSYQDDYWAITCETHLSGFADDWGTMPTVAVPLRYVQLYAGPFLGVRNEHEEATGRPPRGVDWHAHLVLGVNGYATRNLRLFVQWEDPPVARIGEIHRQSVIGGLRWSPDYFHGSRPTRKVDMVWWAAALTFISWGIASASQ